MTGLHAEQMATLVWEGPRRMALRDAPLPIRKPGEALIRVAATGICGSELEGYVGRMANRVPPLVMGHEFSGVVVEAESDALIGARVVANPLISCWHCEFCRDGSPHLCPERKIIGIHLAGAFAEFVVVPESNLVALPSSLSLEGAALVEPLANVLRAVGRAWARGIPESVAVIGAGSLGLLVTQVVAGMGISELFVVDRVPGRLELARSLGATHTVESRETESGASGELTAQCDVVIDCVGAAQTKVEAIQQVKSGGTVVLLGLHDDATPISSHALVRREITIAGSVTYTPHEFRRAVQMLASDSIEFRSWTVCRPLVDGPRSFDELLEPAGHLVKVLLGAGDASESDEASSAMN